jgi:hypothetical protein
MKRKRKLGRESGTVRDAVKILIASEDTYAVAQYFDPFRSDRAVFAVLPTVDTHSAPEHVLSRLVDYMAKNDIGEGDQFWLLIDCDHWIEPNHIATLSDVLTRCRQKGIFFDVSRPCFELWLLLHYDEFPAEENLTAAEVVTLLKAVAGGYSKRNMPLEPITLERIRRAVERAKANPARPQEIPRQLQTGVYRIFEDLLERNEITLVGPA